MAALSGSEEGSLGFDELVRASKVEPDQARRGLTWLSSKGLVRTTETTTARLEPASRIPPELALFERAASSPDPQTMRQARQAFSSDAEFSAALGRARSLGWVTIASSAEGPALRVSDSEGPADLKGVLDAVSAGTTGSLDGAGREMLEDLKRRGIVNEVRTTSSSVALTGSGRAALSASQEGNGLDRMTPEILASGAWKGQKLRPIDVASKGATFYPGRRHPVRDFIREVKEAYVSMGFTELDGGSVHPAFWNFDALFIPQDHPGREMQDTFYIEGMTERTLVRKGVVDRVASTHEGGWLTGSRGWGRPWRVEEARRLLLRPHNTVLTVRSLSESGNEEKRVFAVSKVYRNENLDYKHLHEFHQMDGIMVGKGLNVRHLMGFLSEFYKKLGMRDVKLWPTYFPYTEPSMQVMGYSDAVKDWVELGGAGVFRPEVTRPLGVTVPVLAWGPGIERLMLLKYGLDDLRELYGNDLTWLRGRAEHAGR